MTSKVFCDIDPKYYLFGKNETPEEKVRQWALFELLSVYNVPVQSISIEVPVKLGTRSHRADIVVLKDYYPWIVLECKRTEHSDTPEGIKQALSYANCLQSEFAVYTNGKVWLVKRYKPKFKEWISIPDLPIYTSRRLLDRQSFTHLSRYCNSLSVLMRWFYNNDNTLRSRDMLLDSLRYLSKLKALEADHFRFYNTFKLLEDVILFFKNNHLSQSFTLNQASSILQESRDHFIRLYKKLISCCEKNNLNLNFSEEILTISFSYGHPSFNSINDLLEFCRLDPQKFPDAFDLFFLSIRRVNDNCINLMNLEALVLQVTCQITIHFEREWINGYKIPITHSNFGLVSSIVNLIEFIAEDYFGISIPSISDEEAWLDFMIDSGDLHRLINTYTLEKDNEP